MTEFERMREALHHADVVLHLLQFDHGHAAWWHARNLRLQLAQNIAQFLGPGGLQPKPRGVPQHSSVERARKGT